MFETEFQNGEEPAAIYALSCEDREVAENSYIKTVYFGVQEHLEEIDALIMRHSKGWKISRITPVSRSAIRLCIYEMLYMKEIPSAVSLNEAIELVKQFDDPKMKAFVNGLLNGAKNEIEAGQAE
ncbi:MAG: transcription antitermination factor NusB [Clostridia bacterium]|nr:transcription antitermination factor NusB [Clostridia bacterium]